MARLMIALSTGDQVEYHCTCTDKRPWKEIRKDPGICFFSDESEVENCPVCQLPPWTYSNIDGMTIPIARPMGYEIMTSILEDPK
ncbi:MAG: hypothetical protein DRH06_00325 [Deltaproteobacteria bacterium]|nr:MAG: hypothetical protein DRH06_00325 [Deltaproteobacteria bacterium]